MNKIKINKCIFLIAIGSLSLLFNRCVEPFIPDLDEGDTRKLLVVEGLITDQPGPFSVRLTYSVPVYDKWNILADYMPVEGAEIRIIDDTGNIFMLFETESGWYETEEKDLEGIPGHSYILTIHTTDGKQYESSTELMREVPGIDSVYHEEFMRTYFEEETPYEENGLHILVNTRAAGDDIAYFKWEFEETWEFEMPGYIEVQHGTDEQAPPPTWEEIYIEEERKHCWVSESSRLILVKSTVDNASNEIRGFILQSAGGPSDDRLNIKYSILVKQYMISRELYDFFRKIRGSNEETGGIYEKAPTQIIGNILCCNGDEEALGYFMASAVKTKRIFISPGEHKVLNGTAYGLCGWTTFVPPPPHDKYHERYFYGTYDNGKTIVRDHSEYCVDCRIRGTNIQPDFWE